MVEKRRLNLSFAMSSPYQREAWEQIAAIPPGQRTDAICRMIHNDKDQQELLDTIRSAIREELNGAYRTTDTTAAQEQAGDMDENVLGFLLALQEEGDDMN